MSYREHHKRSASGSSKRIVIPSGSIDPNRPSVIEIPITNEYTVYDPSRQFDHSLNGSRNFMTPAAIPPAPVPVQANLCTSCGQDHSMMNRTTPNYPQTSTPIRANSIAPSPNLSMIAPQPQYYAPISNNPSYQSTGFSNQQRRYTSNQQLQNYIAAPTSNYHSASCPMNQSRYHPQQYQPQHRQLSPYSKSPSNGNMTKQEISELIDEKFKVLMTAFKNNQNDNQKNSQNDNLGQGATESNPVRRRLYQDNRVKNDTDGDVGLCDDRTCNSCIMKDGVNRKKK